MRGLFHWARQEAGEQKGFLRQMNTSTRANPVVIAAAALLLISVCLLYGLFLHNPLIFDDIYFFNGTVHQEYLSIEYLLRLRWLPYATYEWTRMALGLDLMWFRLGNLLLHLANALLLFTFLRRLFELSIPQSPAPVIPNGVLALGGTALFALHPAAVYAVAYLTQRSTLMATLFVLVMLNAALLGIATGRSRYLAASALAYFVAAMSKELAVMAPMLVLALAVLTRRNSCLSVKHWLLPSAAYLLAMAFVTYLVKSGAGVIGEAYQLNGSELLDRMAAADPGFDPALAYPLSILTQASLFFKYLLVWLAPSARWMSVDMYEALAPRLSSWPYLLGTGAFVAYGVFALRLLWQGGRVGMLGFGLMCPWLMFFTEFSTVRVADPFVIYRSYLWMFGLFAALPWIAQKLSQRNFAVALLVLSALMIPPTMLRLQVFSHPYFLWDDAARLVDSKPVVPGVERVYANRGNEEARMGRFAEAVKDYDKAIAIYPRQANVHSDRGAALLNLDETDAALASFQTAISLQPDLVLARLGVARIAQLRGDADTARREYETACKLGSDRACKKLAMP
jgi:tetratricopeptide (TPR) repeat protein